MNYETKLSHLDLPINDSTLSLAKLTKCHFNSITLQTLIATCLLENKNHSSRVIGNTIGMPWHKVRNEIAKMKKHPENWPDVIFLSRAEKAAYATRKAKGIPLTELKAKRLLIANPDWSVYRIAEELNVDRVTASKSKI